MKRPGQFPPVNSFSSRHLFLKEKEARSVDLAAEISLELRDLVGRVSIGNLTNAKGPM